MRNNNMVETLIGALVVVIALGFVVFAYSNTSAGGLSGYPLEARFSSADESSGKTHRELTQLVY